MKLHPRLKYIAVFVVLVVLVVVVGGVAYWCTTRPGEATATATRTVTSRRRFRSPTM
jgi:CHASE3 domain sensor protein